MLGRPVRFWGEGQLVVEMARSIEFRRSKSVVPEDNAALDRLPSTFSRAPEGLRQLSKRQPPPQSVNWRTKTHARAAQFRVDLEQRPKRLNSLDQRLHSQQPMLPQSLLQFASRSFRRDPIDHCQPLHLHR
jgi:hypothetical protein